MSQRTPQKKGRRRASPLVGELKGQVAELQRELEEARRGPHRRKLADTRRSITHKFNISGHEGYVTAGLYEDGTPGEVFIKMAKQGSTISGLVDTIAILTSLALQYGVPVAQLARKFEHTRFEPSGHTTNTEIPHAASISDYVFRWLRNVFCEGMTETGQVERENEDADVSNTSD